MPAAPPFLFILIVPAAAVVFAYVLRRSLSRCAGLARTVRGEGGQGLVEMAMLLPMLLVLVVGVIEVANSLNTYITIVNSARDGARLGSKGSVGDAAIRSLVVTETGRLRDATDPNADVKIEYVLVDDVDAVRVTVCNDHKLLLGVPLVVPDTFRMCSTTAMRVLTVS